MAICCGDGIAAGKGGIQPVAIAGARDSRNVYITARKVVHTARLGRQVSVHSDLSV